MMRKISTFLFGLLFLVGFGILAYPTISNQWNTYRQSRLISNYDNVVKEMAEEDFEQEWEAARSYNQTFEKNSIRSDIFGLEESDDIEGTAYWQVMNVAGDGIMGYPEDQREAVHLPWDRRRCAPDGSRASKRNEASHRRRE